MRTRQANAHLQANMPPDLPTPPESQNNASIPPSESMAPDTSMQDNDEASTARATPNDSIRSPQPITTQNEGTQRSESSSAAPATAVLRVANSHATPQPAAEQQKEQQKEQREEQQEKQATPMLQEEEEEIDTHEQLGVLGRGMKEMVDIINKLRASGVQSLGMPLPRIAVVGNQSAGKSSLIEAISGIKVPRYSGTCTRCPLEINLRRSDSPVEPWRCRISLRKEKDYTPSKVVNPWVAKSRPETINFLEIHDKTYVEAALERAQEAILNPTTHWREYLQLFKKETSLPPQSIQSLEEARRLSSANNSANKTLEVKFSPNVVCMEITGPNLPNLAFIDLPGVIQTTESEEEKYLISLVTELVKDYIQEEGCLILLALTMKDDANNQSAAGLARDFGEDRTIGALTKPDTVEPGDHGQWVKILRNEAHRIHHGYFVTKQPNQAELNRSIDNAEARRLEKAFFETTSPWNDELADLQHRFGTEALAEYLADQLGNLIRDRLPGIQEEIEKQLSGVEAELQLLPAPPTENQIVTVNNLLHNLESLIAEHLNNAPGRPEFTNGHFEIAQIFRDKIKNDLQPSLFLFDSAEDEKRMADLLKTPSKSSHKANRVLQPPSGHGGRPRQVQRQVSPSPSGRKKNTHEPSEVLEITSDDENSGRGMLGVAPATPKKRPRQEHGGDRVATNLAKRQKSSTGLGLGPETHLFSLPHIRRAIRNTAPSTRIPDQVSPEVPGILALEAVRSWKPHIDVFHKQSRNLLLECLAACLKEILRSYSKTPLYNRVKKALETVVEHKSVDFHLTVELLWKWESGTARTLLDQETYRTLKDMHLAELREKRRQNVQTQRNQDSDHAQEQQQQAGKGRKRPQQNPNAAENMIEPYEQELGVLADVRAYHEIASNRFSDTLYSAFVEECVMETKNSISGELRRSLRLDTPDAEEECKRLLVEDPAKELRRKELLLKKDQLEDALKDLTRW